MKRSHKETLKAVLKALDDGKPHSYGDIERKANTNWKSVRDHVELLVLIDASVMEEGKVKITERGVKLARKL